MMEEDLRIPFMRTSLYELRAKVEPFEYLFSDSFVLYVWHFRYIAMTWICHKKFFLYWRTVVV